MRLSLISIATIAAICCATPLAQAAPHSSSPPKKLYHWVGPDGRDHYSDDLPPEAMNQAREELSKGGLTLKRVERALTVEERSAEKAKAAAEATAAAIADKSHQSDQVLLSSYPNEAELTRAYKDRLDQQNQAIKTIRIELQSQQQSLTALLIAASNLELSDKPITKELARKIQISHSQVLDDQRAQLLQLAQADKLREEGASQLEHYRSLRAAAEAKRNPEASEQATDSTAPPKG